MIWQEVQAAADREAIVLLPVGIVEEENSSIDFKAYFDSLAYCGDPACYEQEINVAEICSIDVKIDALKIKDVCMK